MATQAFGPPTPLPPPFTLLPLSSLPPLSLYKPFRHLSPSLVCLTSLVGGLFCCSTFLLWWSLKHFEHMPSVAPLPKKPQPFRHSDGLSPVVATGRWSSITYYLATVRSKRSESFSRWYDHFVRCRRSASFILSSELRPSLAYTSAASRSFLCTMALRFSGFVLSDELVGVVVTLTCTSTSALSSLALVISG